MRRLCRVFSDYFSPSQFVRLEKLKPTNLFRERFTMKKIVIAALLSAVSGAALATTEAPKPGPASASMVFEGASVVVTPGAAVAITGENGAPLATGTLNVKADGSFTTKDPVMFEIRDVNTATGAIGDVSTSGLQMKYASIELIAGTTAGAVSSAGVTVALSGGATVSTDNGPVTARDGLSVSKTEPTTGYIAGETVKTTVAVLVTSAPAAG